MGVGGQLGLAAGVVVVSAGGWFGWAGGGWATLPIAAAALAAAKVTAKGILGLTGEGSHLDLLVGLPVSPPSSVGCRVLLLAAGWAVWLKLGLGVVLCLLPTLTQVLGEDSAPATVATVAPAVTAAVAIAGDGDGSAAATIAASACLPAAVSASSLLGTAPSCLCPATPATEAPERYSVSV